MKLGDMQSANIVINSHAESDQNLIVTFDEGASESAVQSK
jgi:hypothetical protein